MLTLTLIVAEFRSHFFFFPIIVKKKQPHDSLMPKMAIGHHLLPFIQPEPKSLSSVQVNTGTHRDGCLLKMNFLA